MKKIIKFLLKIITIIAILLVIIIIIAFIILNFYPSIGKTPSKEKQKEYESLPNYSNGKFHNLHETNIINKDYEKNKDSIIKPKKKLPVIKLDKLPESKEDELLITWLGHSSSIINIGSKRILIDPVLSNCTSPVSFIGPTRFSEIPINPKDIKDVDFVVISHDHYDHLDYKTIKSIASEVKHFIVPLGLDSYLKSWGIEEQKITTFNWWDEQTIDEITFTSIPAQHYTGRNPLKQNTTLWSGFYISNNKYNVYYTGDTGLDQEIFNSVKEKFPNTDLMLADTGQYNVAWSSIHMNPYDSLQSAKTINPRYYIPVHWGSYVLSDHDWYEPAKIIEESASFYNVSYLTPQIGLTVNIENTSNVDNTWWKSFK